jgi:hypothetical protein
MPPVARCLTTSRFLNHRSEPHRSRRRNEKMTMPTNSDSGSPQQESRFHTYSSHVIPWYIRVMWIVFWIFAISYVVANFLPAIQTELLAPP